MMKQWHLLTTDAVLSDLGVALDAGLDAEQIERRRAEYGRNELAQVEGRTAWQICRDQLSGPMILLLFIAAGVSFALGETLDGSVILTIVGLNAALGFSQERRAEQALAALTKLATPIVRARRGGLVVDVPSADLTPGDIVTLAAGGRVPADCRIVESASLRVDESALTGESESVEKSCDALAGPDLAVADRVNMAFMGSIVVYGRGWGVVTSTGMHTQLGAIADSLQNVEPEPTPLQRRLGSLGKTLAVVALAVVALVFFAGLQRNESPQLMLMAALSLAVAVVPEGLPAVATVALALGARRMVRRQALIRKLPAVETLGSVTVVCTDKTGTLTENRMSALRLVANDVELRLDDAPWIAGRGSAAPSRWYDDHRTEIDSPAMQTLLVAFAMCSDAEIASADDGDFAASGDPTETALSLAAAHLGVHQSELQHDLPRIGEIPFDSLSKRMATLHRYEPVDKPNMPRILADMHEAGSGRVLFVKGAFDRLLPDCDDLLVDDGAEPLDDAQRAELHRRHAAYAREGMRVLAAAISLAPDAQLSVEKSSSAKGGPAYPTFGRLTFVGMAAMIDPPRPEAAEAVARCREAGIRPVMITGDHALTAQAIGKQLGFLDDDHVVTGVELDRMSPAELEFAACHRGVFARVEPRHKLRLVQALQARDEIVAMTGDGVNDAPALKQAHIGVAMGVNGADVSKEASQMILLDDNFATIVAAVEEGRVVYDNIRKFIRYVLTCNAGEICVIVMASALGMPLPLLPLQILWINLVTDGLPGLALSVEKAERNVMKRPPLPPRQPIVDRRMAWRILLVGLAMGATSLALGYWHWHYLESADAYWRTLVFTVLTLAQMGNALAVRADRDLLVEIGLFSNRALVASIALTVALQMAAIYWGPMQHVFKTVAISAVDLLACCLLSGVVFSLIELSKLARRWYEPVKTRR
ncbi:MAG: cation-translocating P-type ATPase [Planctomycetales bacterium]|nr:cation-translocating P-type ATPase [Planctomycetales bacterium]